MTCLMPVPKTQLPAALSAHLHYESPYRAEHTFTTFPVWPRVHQSTIAPQAQRQWQIQRRHIVCYLVGKLPGIATPLHEIQREVLIQRSSVGHGDSTSAVPGLAL